MPSTLPCSTGFAMNFYYPVSTLTLDSQSHRQTTTPPSGKISLLAKEPIPCPHSIRLTKAATNSYRTIISFTRAYHSHMLDTTPTPPKSSISLSAEELLSNLWG